MGYITIDVYFRGPKSNQEIDISSNVVDNQNTASANLNFASILKLEELLDFKPVQYADAVGILKKEQATPRDIEGHVIEISALSELKSTEKTLERCSSESRLNIYPETLCDEIDCLVCFDKINFDDEVRLINCHHFFHKDCLDIWLTTKSSRCPKCQLNLKQHL
ncbi:putative RING finger protein [Smittium culicis]|uniref:Putative RING finger protein n=1 Tax=Smittium culicis TaxID=133412 RepID=A0A1R1Y6F2_9FUNG|nr:putative RING finger protein [Smittium culicis]